MSLKRRRFTKEFKIKILREIAGGKSLAQASREHQLHPNTIRDWRKQHEHYGQRAFLGNGNAYKDEARIAELERMVGQLTMENALLKKVLQRLEEQPQESASNGGRR
jgi:transposase-like protein